MSLVFLPVSFRSFSGGLVNLSRLLLSSGRFGSAAPPHHDPIFIFIDAPPEDFLHAATGAVAMHRPDTGLNLNLDKVRENLAGVGEGVNSCGEENFRLEEYLFFTLSRRWYKKFNLCKIFFFLEICKQIKFCFERNMFGKIL